jgi:hypothetical protein
MPTAAFDTYTGGPLAPWIRPELASVQNVKLPNSTTVVKGTVLGEVTATPGLFKPYATGNVDGTQVPKAVAMYDVVIDASGNHVWGGGQLGESRPYAPVYLAGYFRTTDLTGFDAGASTAAGWRLVSGSAADGVTALGL